MNTVAIEAIADAVSSDAGTCACVLGWCIYVHTTWKAVLAKAEKVYGIRSCTCVRHKKQSSRGARSTCLYGCSLRKQKSIGWFKRARGMYRCSLRNQKSIGWLKRARGLYGCSLRNQKPIGWFKRARADSYSYSSWSSSTSAVSRLSDDLYCKESADWHSSSM